jgi:hypothetical protein
MDLLISYREDELMLESGVVSLVSLGCIECRCIQQLGRITLLREEVLVWDFVVHVS